MSPFQQHVLDRLDLMTASITALTAAVATLEERTKAPPAVVAPPRQLLRDGGLTAVGGGIGAAIAAIVQGLIKP